MFACLTGSIESKYEHGMGIALVDWYKIPFHLAGSQNEVVNGAAGLFLLGQVERGTLELSTLVVSLGIVQPDLNHSLSHVFSIC